MATEKHRHLNPQMESLAVAARPLQPSFPIYTDL
jgi:hypothetical protein